MIAAARGPQGSSVEQNPAYRLARRFYWLTVCWSEVPPISAT